MSDFKTHFITIPNEFLKKEFLETNNLTRKFYVTYLMISRYRTVDGYCLISLRYLLDYVGSPETRRTTTIFQEFVRCLKYMADTNMITIVENVDLDEIRHSDIIKVKINDFLFYRRKFTMVNIAHFDMIPKICTANKPENVLTVFLFMLSCMWRKGGNTPIELPEAYYFGVNYICNEIGMAKRIAEQCIKVLTECRGLIPPLLIKHTKFIVNKRVSIYVINKEGCEEEISKTLNFINKHYSIG